MGNYMPSSVNPSLNVLLPVETWGSAVRYTEGTLVIDRGGFWVATGRSLDSRPISGNTNWTLVAGTPYVDVTLTPVDLTTAPFFSNPASAPGFPAIPAPGAGWTVLPLRAYTTQTDGDAWALNAEAHVFWIDPTMTNVTTFGGNLIPDGLSQDLVTEGRQAYLVDAQGIAAGWTLPPSLDNAALVLQTSTDITDGGIAIGTRSLMYRLFYTIVPATPPSGATFFTITAVNQGTKTLTVSPDPTTTIIPPQSVTIVGSTGQNGSYTALAVTATTIRVKESLPSAVGDGWVEVAA